jgi:ectoine hydroxylase-related dioxygenase (phytanoyl-CoA dioxygenase family)
MTISEALLELGATTELLSVEERERLDEDGYLYLPGILSPGQVAEFNRRLAELAAAEGEQAGLEVHQESGALRLSDLVNKDPLFEVVFTHPRVLAAVAHVLAGDLRLSSLNSRAALPGEGLQALHADWRGAVKPGEYSVCNSLWCLDDLTEANGATRVVPGSHRSGRVPQDDLPDPKATHPDEVRVIAPAGTVVIFNAHAWHGGTLNRTDRPRRVMHGYFCRRDVPQQTDQRRFLRPETRARLSEAARIILDVE